MSQVGKMAWLHAAALKEKMINHVLPYKFSYLEVYKESA